MEKKGRTALEKAGCVCWALAALCIVVIAVLFSLPVPGHVEGQRRIGECFFLAIGFGLFAVAGVICMIIAVFKNRNRDR